MIFVSAADLTESDMALLGNNIRRSRRHGRHARRDPDERTNRPVLAAVNRSLASLHERLDRLYPVQGEPDTAQRKLAS